MNRCAAIVVRDATVLTATVDGTGRLSTPIAKIHARLDDVRTLVDGLAALAAPLMAATDGPTVTGLALAVPFAVDGLDGVLTGIDGPTGLDGAPLARLLRDRLGTMVHCAKSVAAAAHAEWRFGAGRGAHDMVYLETGRELSGAVIVDGRLLKGRRGLAAEFAHLGSAWWAGVPAHTGAERRARANARAQGEALSPPDEADLIAAALTTLIPAYAPDTVVLRHREDSPPEFISMVMAAVRTRVSHLPHLASPQLGDHERRLVGAASMFFEAERSSG